VAAGAAGSAGLAAAAAEPVPGTMIAGIVEGLPTGPIAKPHTSQKSSSADWWPDGQVAIG
jgi:hypothetical protein